MSAIFSDPPFRRGTSLCGGDLTGTGTGNDAPGSEIVGQVKVFQDVNPYTGVRNSNRLVYCVAARFKGTTVADGSTVAGTVYALDVGAANSALSEFTSAATATNIADGRAYGVLDEYLTGSLTQNDVVWLVVKGPTSILKTAGASGNTDWTAGKAAVISATAGKVTYKGDGTSNVGTVMVGQHVGAAADVASAATSIRVNLWSDQI